MSVAKSNTAPAKAAGYSGTPLVQKLGMKPAMCVLLVDAPKAFKKTLGVIPEGVVLTTASRSKPAAKRFELAVVFCKEASGLFDSFMAAAAVLDDAGGLWMAWPKKTSSLKSDVTENLLREVLLPTGYVDNKVCAIDQDWSGLRFVKRKELRTNPK